MSINQKMILQSIYDAIYDSFTMGPSGTGSSPLSRSRNYLCMAYPGTAVDPSQFSNPWSPENPTGSMPSAENFSLLVDPAPLLDPRYTPNGGVDEFYGEIVNANVTPTAVDPAAKKAFEDAQKILEVDGTDFDDNGAPITVPVDSPGLRNYKNRLVTYTNALAAYNAVYLSYDLTKPEDQRKWAILGPTLRGPLDMAYQDLQRSRPGVYETALATVDQYQQSSLASLFSEARRVYTETRKARQGDPNAFWHLCSAYPGNWFSAPATGRITLKSSSLRVSSDSKFTKWGGGAGVSFPLWSVSTGVSHETQSFDLSTETKNMEISFGFSRVDLRRPSWYRPSLISLRGWSTAGRDPGDYSNGDNTANPGQFPLVPHSFIVIRDLQIKAEWGSSDLHVLSEATKVEGGVSFGPFRLSGGYSNSSTSRRFSSQFDGVNVTAPVPSIVGWLCTVQPFAPPSGVPAAPRTRRLFTPVSVQQNPYALPYLAARRREVEPEYALAGDGALRVTVPEGKEAAPTPSPRAPGETTTAAGTDTMDGSSHRPYEANAPVSEYVSAET